MKLLAFGPAVLLGIAAAAAAQAQQIPFQLLLSQSTGASTIQNGAPLSFVSSVGETQTAQIRATFSGPGEATFSQQPAVLGSTTFKASIATTLPLTLEPGDSIVIGLQFLPTSGQVSNALLSVQYSLTVPPTTVSGAPTTTFGSITASLSGSAASFVASYVLQSDQNVVTLQPGGTIPFAPTLVTATAQGALNLTNVGSGPGIVSGVSITGSGFRLSQVPLLPQSVPAGQTLQVLILYKPTGASTDTGQITVTYGTGTTATFNLQGSGISPQLAYQILTNPPTTIPPGGAITMPDTNVGQSSTITIRVFNSGTAPGTVSAVSVAGQGFQITGLQPLPQTLAANASLTFNLTFSPTQVGAATGTLIINSDLLNLTGLGLGAQLQFSYTANGTKVTLIPNGSVVFSPTPVTQSAQVSFDVKNIGTLDTTISSIGVGQSPSPFSISSPPALPLRLAPGSDASFTISFAPTALGFSNGTLLLDTTSIPLTGSGSQPPALPAYSFSGPSGTVAPGSQPTVSLTLANSYPVAVTGTLTLTVLGNLPADNSVQFASGGRSASFVIPANTTSAVFGAFGKQLGLQTGTVASSFTITPTFATQAGGINLTPDTPVTLQFSVAPAAPALTSIQLNVGASTIGISVTGLSTTRTLRAMSVQFAVKPGFTMPISQFSVDVSQAANTWYTSAASQTFGSQFSLTVPFTFQGTVAAGQTLLNSIASVTVSLSNDTGTSNSLQATVQ